MSLPTLFLGIATAADSLSVLEPSEENRQMAARVRASLLTRNWDWVRSESFETQERVLIGLGAWCVTSSNFDTLVNRILGVQDLFNVIGEASPEENFTFPVALAWQPPRFRPCPAWPNTIEAANEASKGHNARYSLIYSWELATRRRLVSTYSDPEYISFEVESF
jgi:hypothetical protein